VQREPYGPMLQVRPCSTTTLGPEDPYSRTKSMGRPGLHDYSASSCGCEL
jgi:hypothetical protein